MDQGQRPALNMELPEEVAKAARIGDIDAVKAWLAAGGSPHATRNNGTRTLLCSSCASSRPSCASVAELLCAAGARDEGGQGNGYCLLTAAMYGAVDTVRVLLKYGSPANVRCQGGTTTVHEAVVANDWRRYRDPWSIANAQAAASIGHQGMLRLLLKHGAAVDVSSAGHKMTPLMFAAKFSGFVSLGVVRELLASGADLDLVTTNGNNAEDIARSQLQTELYYDRGIPENPLRCRRPDAVEAFLELCAGVRAAGSWKRFVKSPRIDMIVLQRLCEAGRASPPPVLARLFPTPIWLSWRESHQIRTTASNQDSGVSTPLPKELVWLILKFWRADRDP